MQAVLPAGPSHIQYARCTVKIGSAVHLTDHQDPQEGRLLESNDLFFNFARRGTGIQFNPETPPQIGVVRVEFKLGETVVTEEREIRLTVS